MVIFGMQSATWLPRRLKLYADVFTAIELAVLGYLSFIYQVLNEWRIPDYVPMNERRLAVIGVTLLSLSGCVSSTRCVLPSFFINLLTSLIELRT